MALNYPGGYITKSPPTPTSTSAPGIWTLEQAMQYIKAGTWPTPPIGDPYWQYTALLSGTGSTNGAQNNTFIDSSSNNFTVTRNGNTTQGTFTPFSVPNGYWGVFFDGTDDYLYPPANTAFDVGSGDFCVETFAYLTDNVNVGIFQIEDAPLSSTFTGLMFWAQSSGYWQGRIGTTNFLGTSATPAPLNTWLHLAVTRSSGTLRVFQNGVQIYAGTHTDDLSSKNVLTIGGIYASSYCMQGYLSNFRFVKGSAVYTSNFTPSTTPLTAISNTSVLTCQTNRFVDNSANNFAITSSSPTLGGTNPSIAPFAPFGSAEMYSVTSAGGSGYFDAGADYLSLPNNSNLAWGSGTFTFEFWVYNASGGLNQCIYDTRQAGLNPTGEIVLNITSGYEFRLSEGGATRLESTGTAAAVGQWIHVAIERNSSNLVTLYVNGVSKATWSTTTNFVLGNTPRIGYTVNSSLPLDGYITGMRLVKGSAVYNGTFTPPTAPPTAISNTQLLLNFTNAGIYDQAAKNDFETVGNAQVSTSVVKYGNGSMYFDGVGDRLYRFNSQLYNFGTGDFTVECWVYIAANTSYATLIDFSADGGGGYGWFLEYSSTRGVYWYMGTGGGNSNISASLTPALTTWTHVAVTRAGGYAKIFINGNQVAAASLTSSSVSTEPLVIGSSKNGTYPFNGYLSDVRITKGLARYTYNFTPPTRALGAFFQAAATPTADPYFDYTTLLLPGTGTNGAQNNTFLDSSTNAFSITRNGNTTQGTFSPFSQTGWSNYFDGSGDYLTTATSASGFSFGTGDFTVEFWINSTQTGRCDPVGQNTAFASSGWWGIIFNLSASGDMAWYENTNSRITASSTGWNNGGWNHVAVTRSGNSVRMFLNGNQVGSTYTTSFTYGASNVGVIAGVLSDDKVSGPLTGYISNLRILKGTAQYTANFTVPTAPLTAITNTSLLTCQSNRFIDNSTNAFTITVNGNPSVQAFSPFAPTAAYSAATNGGSGYFDGTGDSLSCVANSTNNPQSGDDYTVEAWIYLTNQGNVTTIYSGDSVGYFAWRSSGRFEFVSSSLELRLTYTAPLNRWCHVAVSRQSGTVRMFVDGVLQSPTVVSGSATGNTDTLVGASTAYFFGSYIDATSGPFYGYMSGFRIVKGTAVYTATFTLPTAPPTAITNTAILLNYTNAGITDATAKNDLETVGNAQISNTTAKFGSTSMYFDGTGDYLVSPPSPNYDFGSGDFTIEGWINFASGQGSNYLVVLNNNSNISNTTGAFAIQIFPSDHLTFRFYNGSSDTTIEGTSDIGDSNWHHFAVTRYGTSIKLFIDGSNEATATSSAQIGSASTLMYVGIYTGALYAWNGYIQDLRITKGIARYTQNFTPPTAAFQLL